MQPVNNALVPLMPATVVVVTSSLQLTLLVISIIRFRGSRPGSLLSDDSTFFLLHQLFCVTLKLVTEALALAAANFSTLSGWFPRFQAASVLIALTMQAQWRARDKRRTQPFRVGANWLSPLVRAISGLGWADQTQLSGLLWTTLFMVTEFILSLVTMDVPPESTVPLRSSVTVLILSTGTLSISGSVPEEYRTLLLSILWTIVSVVAFPWWEVICPLFSVNGSSGSSTTSVTPLRDRS